MTDIIGCLACDLTAGRRQPPGAASSARPIGPSSTASGPSAWGP